jgi:uncharacterized membrane protein YphA (DoxX/SURF4 family)
MQNPFATPTASNLGFLAIRVTLGAYMTVHCANIVRKTTIPEFIKQNLSDTQKLMGAEAAQVFLAIFLPLGVVAGLAILAGFFTRSAAFIATVLILCALYATEKSISLESATNIHIILLSIAIMLLTNGGGTYTIPNLLGKKGGGKPPAPPVK